MRHRRTRSSLRILDLHTLKNLLAKVSAQVLGGSQIGLVAVKESGQFPFQARYAQKSRRVGRFKLHQHVHVALGAKIGRKTEPNRDSRRMWRC